MTIVFLSHPVSDYLSSKGVFRPEKHLFISSIIEALQAAGLDITCAALNEDYGRIKLSPLDFTRYDVNMIENCDVFVLVTLERMSSDMYLEIGIALNRKIPVYLFIPASARATYMLLGLQEMNQISIIKFDAEAGLPGLIRENLAAFSSGENKR